MWRYNKIFEEAKNTKGEIEWDEVERLSGIFWNSLKETPGAIDKVLSAIRKTEKEYPESFQKMLQAGRYVQSVKLLVGEPSGTNQPMAYWDLKRHPDYIAEVADNADVSEKAVLAYLELPWQLQEAKRNVPGNATNINEAIEAAGRSGGIYDELKDEFVETAGLEAPAWITGMLEGGYSYGKRGEEINNNIREQIRDGGASLPSFDYVNLWKQEILK